MYYSCEMFPDASSMCIAGPSWSSRRSYRCDPGFDCKNTVRIHVSGVLDDTLDAANILCSVYVGGAFDDRY